MSLPADLAKVKSFLCDFALKFSQQCYLRLWSELLHVSLLPLAAKRRRRSEDTSRSGKGLAPSALPLFPSMQQASAKS
jgi:hypothetical protein